jgi:tight adherence protein C
MFLNIDINMFLLIGSCVLAFVFGVSIWKVWQSFKLKREHKVSVLGINDKASGEKSKSFDVHRQTIEYIETLSKSLELGKTKRFAPEVKTNVEKLETQLTWAGLNDKISIAGYCEARMRLAVVFSIAFLVIGMIFSTELALLGFVLGLLVGFNLPDRSVKKSANLRCKEMEAHLPEMLDVVALGMRSGLSFDSSLMIYTTHFDTALSHEIALAQKKWTSGLDRRDDALRTLAKSYDSKLFLRCVETIVRSIRFGTQMAENLERAAAQARVVYRTSREEAVAKAPVKMMIPTGTLILPAMLIMVLGPVILELMQGGF